MTYILNEKIIYTILSEVYRNELINAFSLGRKSLKSQAQPSSLFR